VGVRAAQRIKAEKEVRIFFSEEKKQKTFISCATSMGRDHEGDA
jgi:hypothetical protein